MVQILVDIIQRMGFDQADYDPDTMLQGSQPLFPLTLKVLNGMSLAKNGKQWPVAADGKEHRNSPLKVSKGKGKFHLQHTRETNEVKPIRKNIRISSPPIELDITTPAP